MLASLTLTPRTGICSATQGFPRGRRISSTERLPASAFDDLRSALDNPKHVFKEAPFTSDIVRAMQQVSRDDVPDMPDRIVAATALYLGVPVISRDGKIRASNVPSVW